MTKPEDIITNKYFNFSQNTEIKVKRIELLKKSKSWNIELREKPLIMTTAYGMDKHTNDITNYFEGLFEWQFRYKTKYIINNKIN